jgi:hypothetical protein
MLFIVGVFGNLLLAPAFARAVLRGRLVLKNKRELVAGPLYSVAVVSFISVALSGFAVYALVAGWLAMPSVVWVLPAVDSFRRWF